MRWDAVARATSQKVAEHPVIQGIYGNVVRMASPAARHEVPALEYRIISDSEMEQWVPIIFQWDQWTNTYAELAASERVLYEMFHQEAEVFFGDVMVLTRWLDGMELADPDRQGYFGRAVRFRVVAIADRYVAESNS